MMPSCPRETSSSETRNDSAVSPSVFFGDAVKFAARNAADGVAVPRSLATMTGVKLVSKVWPSDSRSDTTMSPTVK